MGIYQESFNRKSKEQYDLVDYTAWLNGSYIINAIQTALNPKKVKYIDCPVSQKKEETQESGAEQFILWADEFNRRFEGKHS